MHFCYRNNTQPDIIEAMQAALLLVVKNPRGKNYQNFLTQVKLKTSRSPFFSMVYNSSAISFANTVSTHSEISKMTTIHHHNHHHHHHHHCHCHCRHQQYQHHHRNHHHHHYHCGSLCIRRCSHYILDSTLSVLSHTFDHNQNHCPSFIYLFLNPPVSTVVLSYSHTHPLS